MSTTQIKRDYVDLVMVKEQFSGVRPLSLILQSFSDEVETKFKDVKIKTLDELKTKLSELSDIHAVLTIMENQNKTNVFNQYQLNLLLTDESEYNHLGQGYVFQSETKRKIVIPLSGNVKAPEDVTDYVINVIETMIQNNPSEEYLRHSLNMKVDFKINITKDIFNIYDLK